jgi:transposase
MTVAARFRPGDPDSVEMASKVALRSVARRWVQLDRELTDLDHQLEALVEAAAPQLVQRKGMGTDPVGALLVAAGDNPDRLDDEAGFAALCGASPVEASSGKTVRHHLNRGGNREANAALWRIVLVRMGTDATTKAYVERRVKEGKSKGAIMRCLKRYVAREVFNQLPPWPAPRAPTAFRQAA